MVKGQEMSRGFDQLLMHCKGGGSDAFSGITGNPLVGEVSKLLLTRGAAFGANRRFMWCFAAIPKLSFKSFKSFKIKGKCF